MRVRLRPGGARAGGTAAGGAGAVPGVRVHRMEGGRLLMARFVGEIRKLRVETHPRADRLEIAGVMGCTRVVRPVPERSDTGGRVMPKGVSPEHLCRSGGTGYS